MTVQEAIKHARKVVKKNRSEALECEECANRKIDKVLQLDKIHKEDAAACIKCAEEHEQLAEWLEELEQYRALGTVEGFKSVLDSNLEYYGLFKEYKAKYQEYAKLGTVEELKEAREKQIQEKWIECPYADLIMCPSCNAEFSTIDNCTEQFEYCPKCGKRLE